MKTELNALGYREYTADRPNMWCMQKRVGSKIVCDLNDKLFINIEYNDNKNHFPSIPNINNTFDVYLMAEKHTQWFKLECYGVNEDLFLNELPIIEKRLINAFIAIHNTK